MTETVAGNTYYIEFMAVGAFVIAILAIWFYNQRAQNPLAKKSNYVLLFVAVAVAAFLVRLYIAGQAEGFKIDLDNFKYWANASYEDGYASFYNGDFHADYPPLYMYALSFLGFLRNALSLDFASAEFTVIMKMPGIICDIIVGAIIFFMARRRVGEKMALCLSAFVLLGPAFMMNSAAWGQVDMLLFLLYFLTLYFMYKGRYIVAAVMFALCCAFKPQAVFIAPVILFVLVRYIIKSKSKKKSILTVAASVGVFAAAFFLVALPFQGENGPLWLIDKYVEMVGQYPQASLNALNLMSLLGLNYVDASSAMFMGLPASVWGYVLIGVVLAYALWLYVKNPKKEFIFAIAAFIIMGVFYFSHGIHERYLLPVPVLLIITYIFVKDRRLVLGATLLTAVLLINQGLALYYYLEWIPQGLMQGLSALSLAAFLYTAWVLTDIARGNIKELKLIPYDKKETNPMESARMRLETFETKKHLTKKDGLIMLIISIAYAIVAFTNLGSMTLPETSTDVAEEVTIEFEGEEHISFFKYYAGYGEADFKVLYSADGENYFIADLINRKDEVVQDVEHAPGNLYKWHMYETDIDAKFLEIRHASGSLPILEMGLFDENGERIAPKAAYAADGSASNWFDEQDYAKLEQSYMTDFYFDELYHARTAYENIHTLEPYEWTHPPLGKLIIAVGINMFGMVPFGWRFMGTLTGVLMLPIIYIIAKMLLKSRKFAAFATILLAADFMHFAQTRISTIDSYSVLFIMLMYLFMWKYTQTNFNVQPLKKTLVPLFLTGLFFGIGAATKWLCIYAGLGLLAIFIIMMYKRHKEYRYAKESGDEKYAHIVQNYRKNVVQTLLWCVLFFIIIPAAIYLAAYIPYTLVTVGDAYTFKDILHDQKRILSYHANLTPDTVHPFSSMWYTWPADVRPVLFFSYQNEAAGTISTLSTMGNPLIWWTGIVAVIWLAVDAIRKKHRSFAALFLAIAALSQFVPWMFIEREVYIYHYFATLPFLIILMAMWLKNLQQDFRFGKQFGYVFIVASIVMFAVFYPVITGVPADAGYVTSLRWLGSWPFY